MEAGKQGQDPALITKLQLGAAQMPLAVGGTQVPAEIQTEMALGLSGLCGQPRGLPIPAGAWLVC